ncbi:MAG: hypothetical protein AAB638_00725 [Patescibacteria group bacterium]
MKRLVTILAYCLLPISYCIGQTGVVPASAVRSKLADSTALVVPSGYGVLTYLYQSNEWVGYENGVRKKLFPTLFGTAIRGLVPASGGGTVNFLRADGSWAPAGGITNSAASTELMVSDGTNAIGGKIFSQANGDLTLGDGGLSGTNRTLSASGSAADVGFSLNVKGAGKVTIRSGSPFDNYYEIAPDAATFTSVKGSLAAPASWIISAATGLVSATTGQNLNLNGGAGYASGDTNGGNVSLTSGLPNASGTEGAINIQTRAGAKLGFFNATAVVKQGAVTTSQEIADALTAYGLIPTSTVTSGSGDMVLADVQTVTGAKTFNDTKFFLRNVANTFNGNFVNTNTADRIYTLKDAAGTLAFTSDITGINSGTNTGDQTSIVGITGSLAEFNTALTGADFATGGGTATGANTGDQTINNTSDATSHTVTLSASGGSVQLIEGSNITLTTGGTGSAGTVTIASTGGGGITNSAANTELMVSDGTNAIGGKIFSPANGNATFGDTGLAGADRVITASGSAANVGFQFVTKASGNILLSLGTSAAQATLSTTGLVVYGTTTNTTTVGNVLDIKSNSSGVEAVGFGGAITFTTFTGSVDEIGGIISSVSTDLTGASEDFDIVFKTMAAGAAANEKLRMISTGQLKLSSYTSSSSFSGTPVGSLQFDASGNILTATQQSVNTILVNNVTSGGTVSVIANYTDLTIYTNDAAIIRNNFYRLTEKVLKLETALRNLGVVID